MKHSVMLTIASLLSILFFTLHLADDIVRGMGSAGDRRAQFYSRRPKRFA
jgi:hypothetical protein